MPESVFSGLLHSLDKCEISRISTTFGESEQRVSRGMESAVAAVLAALTREADHFGTLQGMLDLVPEDLGQVSWSKLASGMTNPARPWMAEGKNVVSALFGSNTDHIATLLGRESSVRPDTAVTMLAMAAPMTLSFLRRRVQDDALSMHGLSAVLRKEAGTVRGALPAGMNDLLWGRKTEAPVSPDVVQPVRHVHSFNAWARALALALVVVAGLAIWAHLHRSESGTGSASRIASEPGRPGETGGPRQTGAPGQPDNEVETRLLGTLGSLNASGHPAWVTFDHIRFAPGSATLSADSKDDLDQIAALLRTHPELDLLIAGYTEHGGDTAGILRASRSRADAIKAALVARAVSPGRIATQGVEEEGPSADTPLVEGQAANRHISMRITQP